MHDTSSTDKTLILTLIWVWSLLLYYGCIHTVGKSALPVLWISWSSRERFSYHSSTKPSSSVRHFCQSCHLAVSFSPLCSITLWSLAQGGHPRLISILRYDMNDYLNLNCLQSLLVRDVVRDCLEKEPADRTESDIREFFLSWIITVLVSLFKRL